MATEKELLAKYMELYNVYKNNYEDKHKYLLISAMLHGVCLEIRSDIIKYTIKNKKSPTEAENRLKIIEIAVNNFDYLINEGMRQQQLNTILMNKNCELELKVNELEEKINSINDYNS